MVSSKIYNPKWLTSLEANKLASFALTLPQTREIAPRNNSNLLRRVSLGSWNDQGISAKAVRRGSMMRTEQSARPTMDVAPWQIKQVAIKLSLLARKPVNYISVLGYQDQHDHIDWHQHAEDRATDARVYIISLGETRTFGLREICPACRVCDACNEAACDGHKNKCMTCVQAKLHRETCSIINDKTRWMLFEPAHGSLISIPSDFNFTHEHAVLDDKDPKGLRISINTKCWQTDESLEDFIARMEIPTSSSIAAAKHVPQVYDCHAGKKYPADAIYVGCKTVMYGKVLREGTIFGNAQDPFDPTSPSSLANRQDRSGVSGVRDQANART